jgi:MoaA/NifB/PqqE/SkfB family radical SAM enzyme
MYNISSIKKLQIELTTRCNSSCPLCNRNIQGGPVIDEYVHNELFLDDIIKIFPKEILKNLNFVNHCGNFGDPGYATDLIPILRYFRDNFDRYLYQQIRTNGGMRDTDFWKELGLFFAEKQPKFNNGVIWSVDGLEDTNHIYRRNVKWEKVYTNMEAYAKTKAYGRWEYLLFEHNQHQVADARKIAKDLGFIFMVKEPMGFKDKKSYVEVYNKDLTFDYNIFPANYEGTKNIIPKKYIPIKHHTLTDEHESLSKKRNVKCMSLKNNNSQQIFVTSSGHLIPCCYLSGPLINNTLTYANQQFYEKINELGLDKIDLRKRNMIDILQDSEFTNFFIKGWENKSIKDGRLLFCAETCGEAIT